MNEKQRVIVYIAGVLRQGITCHCDIFRRISGMKPATAERRLREIRVEYLKQVYIDPLGAKWDLGYIAKDKMWIFSLGFKHYLQEKAPEIIEAENDADFKRYQEGK